MDILERYKLEVSQKNLTAIKDVHDKFVAFLVLDDHMF